MKSILSLLFSLALVSCSCSKTETIPKAQSPQGSTSVKPSSPPIELPIPGTFTGSSWTIIVPPTYENTPLEELELEHSTIEAFFTNRSAQRLFTIAKESTDAGLDDFVAGNLAQMSNNGITVNSARHTKLSGLDAGLIDSSSETLHVWVWLTVKDGSAYTLACGGSELTPTTETFEECEEVSKGMVIK